MDKKRLSERGICSKLITPAPERAGWDRLAQLFEDYSPRKGRVVVRDNKARGGLTTVCGAHYVLRYHCASGEIA